MQADTDPSNNWSILSVTVTGKNGADLAAIGDTVTGAAGTVVTATIGVQNNGPATLDTGRSGNAATYMLVEVPAGTSTVAVPRPASAPRRSRTDHGPAGQPSYGVTRPSPSRPASRSSSTSSSGSTG